MTDLNKNLICRFCGKACNVYAEESSGNEEVINNNHRFWDDGESVCVYVLCSGCYSRGPMIQYEIKTHSELNKMKKDAIDLWINCKQ